MDQGTEDDVSEMQKRTSVKAGNHHGRQRSSVKNAVYQYTGTGAKNAAIRARALYLYICGLPVRAIARMFSAPPPTVLYWALNFTLKAYEKPVQQGAVSIELGETRHFITSKKTNAGFGRRIAAIPAGLLTGSAGTLKKTLNRLSSFKIQIFFADHWEACAELIPPELLIQTKAETRGIERNNFRQRHWARQVQAQDPHCLALPSNVRTAGSSFCQIPCNSNREEVFRLVYNSF
ncbi:MAG: hypothetical protein Pg6C_06560 [Treponemataceae bacterium]|nr:MAG: hypothetical protein Pg6C_06560 [Treponemataceae bacterium]